MHPPTKTEVSVTATPLATHLAAAEEEIPTDYRGRLSLRELSFAPEQFRTALTGCIVHDSGWRTRIRVSGEDRLRWLNGMVTNSANLPVGVGNYSFVLSPQGRIQGDVHVFNRGEDFVIETDAAQRETLLTWFDHYIIMDDVLLEDLGDSTTTLGLIGPESANTLASAGLPAPGLNSPGLDSQEHGLSFVSGDTTVVRGDGVSLPNFELWCPPDSFPALWRALQQAGATAAGWQAVDWLRIASGTPLFGVDIRERDLPQETNQNRALHFAKGCYIGQEIVERIRSRGNVHRTFSGFIGEVPIVTGSAIMAAAATAEDRDVKSVGEITSSATLPFATGEKHVALGYIRREALDKHLPLSASGSPIVATALPFL